MLLRSLGVMRFAEALRVMNECHAEVVASATHSGFLLSVEHPPVVTMGNRFLSDDMLVLPEGLAQRGIDYAKTDRGGSVTVHEPGQCVLYPIVRLTSKSLTVRQFVTSLEQSMIETCLAFGVVAQRDTINPGVWVGANKIGAIGIRVSEHVSKHGLAFNVCNSLETFAAIVPCGLRGRGVTTLATETKSACLDFATVRAHLEKEVITRLAELSFSVSG